ncbi:MAG: PIN domain-containing protein [Sandaracinaceae bacterium]|nr:PIN domain-containing protein [Sandaracinaceae bacterium]
MTLATLDTGAWIALERRKPRATSLLRAATERGVALVSITPVLAEWWRGATDQRLQLLRAIRVVPFPARVARAAGEAMTQLGGGASLSIDAMVVAFAAMEGGQVVYTSDVDDLSRIATTCFPSVRVLGI